MGGRREVLHRRLIEKVEGYLRKEDRPKKLFVVWFGFFFFSVATKIHFKTRRQKPP